MQFASTESRARSRRVGRAIPMSPMPQNRCNPTSCRELQPGLACPYRDRRRQVHCLQRHTLASPPPDNRSRPHLYDWERPRPFGRFCGIGVAHTLTRRSLRSWSLPVEFSVPEDPHRRRCRPPQRPSSESPLRWPRPTEPLDIASVALVPGARLRESAVRLRQFARHDGAPRRPSTAPRRPGVPPQELVTVVIVLRSASETRELTYTTPPGGLANDLLYRPDESQLAIVANRPVGKGRRQQRQWERPKRRRTTPRAHAYVWPTPPGNSA